ncbi:MAG: hypothetical protein ABSE45_15045 [Candidatus Acidiferrales bacterium]|jgi:hypothetical protein
MAEANLDVGKIVRENLTLHVKLKGVPKFRARLKIGAWLIKLAARIIGMPVEIEMPAPTPTSGFDPHL